jgi:hypothetical protein
MRLADSVTALLFGLHGGLVADRWDRRSVMVAADLFRGATLVPIAVAGLSRHLPLWALLAASFLLEAATSYFAPAFGALVPSLVDRGNVQQANARATRSRAGISEGFAAPRPRTTLAIGVLALGVAVTISSGTWIGGVPTSSATTCTAERVPSRS